MLPIMPVLVAGHLNPKGLRIKSFVDNDIVIAEWMPEAHHEAFPGILNGGIIGTLLDCHSNWSAAYHLMKAKGLDNPPCTVTAYFNVSLKRPTPSQKKVSLLAKIEEISGEQVLVKANLCSSNLEMSG